MDNKPRTFYENYANPSESDPALKPKNNPKTTPTPTTATTTPNVDGKRIASVSFLAVIGITALVLSFWGLSSLLNGGGDNNKPVNTTTAKWQELKAETDKGHRNLVGTLEENIQNAQASKICPSLLETFNNIHRSFLNQKEAWQGLVQELDKEETKKQHNLDALETAITKVLGRIRKIETDYRIFEEKNKQCK